MMELYLIRHGIAADRAEYENDEERPLTAKGRQKTEKVAQRLASLGLRFDFILTSPLVRARQTAEILHAAGLSPQLDISPFLAPEGDLMAWLEWLQPRHQDNNHQTLALVGHQPDLGNWAELLVWGAIKEGLVVKKAGIIGLKLPTGETAIGKSQLFWLTPPKLLL